MERESEARMVTRRQLLLGTCAMVGSVALAVVGHEMLGVKSQDQLPAVETQEVDGTALLLNGQWDYMPGTHKDEAGLHVGDSNFAIVEQDGTLAQHNSMVNLFGTRLDVSGNFSIELSATEVTAGSGLQLYGEVPIIADEFRIERKSVRLGFENNTMTFSVWDGTAQQPTESRSFAVLPQQLSHLQLLRQGDNLTLFANGQPLGVVSDRGIFDSGQVWFGADGKWLLSDLSVTEHDDGRVKLVDTSKLKIDQYDPNGLQILADKKRPGFIIGGAVALGPLVSDVEFAQVALGGNLGAITPENDMKMINIQPQPGVFDFRKADALVQLAERHNLKIHGHALVFGEATPLWFNNLPVETDADKQQIQDIMRQHIGTVVGHYKGRIASWDVINEPMADYDETDDGEGAQLRRHKWQQAMGEDYIAIALAEAHHADPEAMLFINEYGLEDDGDRWDAFIALLQRLTSQLQELGVPLDRVGVGFQSHVYEAGDRINPATLNQHINTLAAMGFRSQVSEMDVYSDDGADVQASQFRDSLAVCINNPNCLAWRFWTWDKYDYWKDDDGTIQHGADGLWDNTMQPLPAISSIKQMLSTK